MDTYTSTQTNTHTDNTDTPRHHEATLYTLQSHSNMNMTAAQDFILTEGDYSETVEVTTAEGSLTPIDLYFTVTYFSGVACSCC